LYASNTNTGLTSGKGLFGADALGGADFGAKSGGGMFDDDEDDIFGSKAPAKPTAQPQQKQPTGLFGNASDEDDFSTKKAVPKKKLGGFLADSGDEDDTFVPGKKPTEVAQPKKNNFLDDDEESDGFVPKKKPEAPKPVS